MIKGENMFHTCTVRTIFIVLFSCIIQGYNCSILGQSPYMITGADIVDDLYVDQSDYYTTNLGIVLYQLNFKNGIVKEDVEKIFDEFMESDYVSNYEDSVYDFDCKYVYVFVNANRLSFAFWGRPNFPILSYRKNLCYWGYIVLGGISVPVYGGVDFRNEIFDKSPVSNPKLFPFYIDPLDDSAAIGFDVTYPELEMKINEDDIKYEIIF